MQDDLLLQLLRELVASQQRIEAKLDVLIDALAEEEDVQTPALTLDGEPAGAERVEGTPL